MLLLAFERSIAVAPRYQIGLPRLDVVMIQTSGLATDSGGQDRAWPLWPFAENRHRESSRVKPSIQTLGQILYSPSQYVIPVFQRNYRWDRAQWQKLWSSITDLRSPAKIGNHFMGFLVFVPGLAQPGPALSS